MKQSVLIALVGAMLRATSVSAQGFVDINAIRVQSAQTDPQTLAASSPLFGEFAGFAASYPALPGAGGVDISGGWISSIGLGAQLSVDLAQYKSTVGLGVSIPSPYFFNTPGTAANVTSGMLDRQDIGVNIGAVYQIPLPSARVALKVFGGPTYFNLKNDMIDDIRYTQSAGLFFRTNIVNITNYHVETVKGSVLGYHVGADLGVFFSRHVGVGGLIRYSHGIVSVLDPLTVADVDIKVGTTTVGAGLRLRF